MKKKEKTIIKIDEWGNVIIKEDDNTVHFSHLSNYSDYEQRILMEKAFDY